MAGLAEQLAEKSQENHERIDKLVPDMQTEPASAEEALAGIKDIQTPSVTKETLPVEARPIDKDDMSMYNYKTGKPLMEDASKKDIARMQAANRAGDALWQLYQEYDNPTDEQIEAALRQNAFAFNTIYGNKKDNWATAFGSGYLAGKLTDSQRAAVGDYIRMRREYEGQKNTEAQDAARAAYDAQYKVQFGETEIPVTQDFSDNVKSILSSYSGLIPEEGEEDTPENIAERQKLIGDAREQLRAAGIDLGPAPAEGEFSTIQELIESAPDYETEEAIVQMLHMAETRKEYNPEEDTRSIEDLYREREERRAALELQTKNRKLERARNRHSFADLAATIGDMIRASEGARVDPRDWQQTYDKLTAQERANVDNYRTRMRQLEEDAKQQRMKDKELAARQQEEEARRRFKAAEAEKARKGKAELQKEKDDAALKRARVYASRPHSGGGSNPRTVNIHAFGETTFVEAGEYEKTMRALNKMLESAGVRFGIKSSITGITNTQELVNVTGLALAGATNRGDGYWDIKTATGTYQVSDDVVKRMQKYINEIVNKQPSSATPAANENAGGNNAGGNGSGNEEEKPTIDVTSFRPR